MCCSVLNRIMRHIKPFAMVLVPGNMLHNAFHLPPTRGHLSAFEHCEPLIVDVIWLLGDEPVPDQSTTARFRRRCTAEVEELLCQHVRLLEKQGETDHLESCAGRYTFCWRGTLEKKLSRIKETVYALTRLTTLCGLQRRTKPVCVTVSFFHCLS